MAGALDIIARDYLGFPSAREVPWTQLRHEHVQAIRTKLGEKYKPATAKRYLSAVKGVLREAWRLGAYSGGELERVRDVRSVPGSAVPAGHALSKGEFKALMDGCNDGTAMGARDAAVIALGYGAGLRRTEIARISLEDVYKEVDDALLGSRRRRRFWTISRSAGRIRARSCGLRARAGG